MGRLDDDLAFILADQVSLTGKGTVVWRGKPLNATFDDADESVVDTAGGKVIEGGRRLVVRTADLPVGAVLNDTLTVDGDSYRVHQPILRQDDGLTAIVWIAPVMA